MSTSVVHDHQHPPHQRSDETRSAKHRRSFAGHLGSGLITGLSLGVAARGFMRLLTDEPEFTWSGTIFIIGLFVVFGLVQGLVAAIRTRTTRRWITVPARLIGGLSYLMLGGGPGVLMVPFLWFGALALWQTTWRCWQRATLATLAAANMVGFIGLTLSEEGFDRLLEPRVIAGFAIFAATYAGAVWSAGPTLSPRSTVAEVPVEAIRSIPTPATGGPSPRDLTHPGRAQR